jgi:hypothetical protein
VADQALALDQADADTDGISASAPGVQYVAGDKGFGSRKLVYGMATSVAIALGGVLAAFVPAFVPVYPIYIGGLTGVLALYTGGNIVQRHVVGRHVVALQQQPGAAPAPKPPVEPLPYEGEASL